MTSSLVDAPTPLVPLATFDVSQPPAALAENANEDWTLAAQAGTETPLEQPTTSPEERGALAPDFLGRLHHLKALFRMSATEAPVSVMIHRVGPLLILDDGPKGWSRGSAEHNSHPLPPLSDNEPSSSSTHLPLEAEAPESLLLAAVDPSLEPMIPSAASDLPEAPPSELLPRLCVKNTFVDVIESDEDDLERSKSAPGRMGGGQSPVTPLTLTPRGFPCIGEVPMSPVMRRLKEHADRAASRWQLIPYQQPEGGEASLPPLEGGSTLLGARPWDLLQVSTPANSGHHNSTVLEAIRSIYSGIPPQPSRYGRAVEWRCGPYKILLGCDLVVFRSDDQQELSELASFKMLPPERQEGPSREERLDVYLENLMCNINKAVWGTPEQGRISWRVFNTSDLPSGSCREEPTFDARDIRDQGQRMLHFLRQKCLKEGGTYWLFREQNSSSAELFDLSGMSEPRADGGTSWQARAFSTTPSLAMPIASLCFHLAKSMPANSDQRQLLQKGLHLLEPCKEEHFGLYSRIALQLACLYMRTPLAAISDVAPNGARDCVEPPPAARLAVALRFLESIQTLLRPLGEKGDLENVSLVAELLLQANVAYAECVVKLVKEACIPLYTSWLTEVQKASQEWSNKPGRKEGVVPPELAQMKRLSAAFLLWRLFWLCRGHRALSFISSEKIETECWTLDRDLCEITGDALYGLSRYPADDMHDLLKGQMASADGICNLVEDALRSWALGGPMTGTQFEASSASKRKSKRLPSPSPTPSPRTDQAPNQVQNVSAMFLSKLNPLTRGDADAHLREDPLVRDDLRPLLWSEGRALKQCMALYEKATARLRKADAEEVGPSTSSSRRPPPPRQGAEDQATLKVARKLAHLYNEAARASLLQGEAQSEKVEDYLRQAHRWMVLSGDFSNATRVLLNLAELYARQAEKCVAAGHEGTSGPFTEAQYSLFLKGIECCEEAVSLSEGELGRREGAFGHLRLGVHLSVRVPLQQGLLESRRSETMAELADRHFSKALHHFSELRDAREVAVCHFHMADLLLQEQKVPDSKPPAKSRLTSALRHARRSADHWESVGALEHMKDFLASHVRIAKLLELQPHAGATFEATQHLAEAESRFIALVAAKPSAANAKLDSSSGKEEPLFILNGGRPIAVPVLRKEMSRLCQSGIRRGMDLERLKLVYRRVLRNEPLLEPSA